MLNLPASVQQAILMAKQSSRDPVSLFVYDLPGLSTHIQGMMASLPDRVELYYAVKANSDRAILDTLAPWVNGFEISSGGEIDQLHHCHKALPFVFSGPGKLDSELESALIEGVEAIHVESLNEIARVQCIAARLKRVQSVFIRVNPSLPATLDSRLVMAGRATPFGMDEADLAEAIARVERAPNLRLKGFHVHALSHQTSVERHMLLMNCYLACWRRWKALAQCPEVITHFNVGGGIGVNYLADEQFDWQDFCHRLARSLSEHEDVPILRFEPGRFISAFCGYYGMEVLDKKHSHGEHFLVCRGGTHQFRLPAAQSHDHPVWHLPALEKSKPEAITEQRWTVVGQLCTPKDVLSRQAPLSAVDIGDVLVLPLAGAYGYNISHVEFLCHPKPHIIYLPESRSIPLDEEAMACPSCP